MHFFCPDLGMSKTESIQYIRILTYFDWETYNE